MNKTYFTCVLLFHKAQIFYVVVKIDFVETWRLWAGGDFVIFWKINILRLIIILGWGAVKTLSSGTVPILYVNSKMVHLMNMWGHSEHKTSVYQDSTPRTQGSI